MIYQILLLSFFAFMYLFLGALFGILLLKKYGHIYDDAGAFVCGIVWPISFPIIVAIFLAILSVQHLLGTKHKGWQSR